MRGRKLSDGVEDHKQRVTLLVETIASVVSPRFVFLLDHPLVPYFLSWHLQNGERERENERMGEREKSW